MFFRRRHEQPSDEEPSDEEQGEWLPYRTAQPVPPVGGLAAIRIYTQHDLVIDGWTRVGSQRLSDVLNGEDALSVSRVAEDPTDEDWQAIDRDEMMLVVAPPHSSPRQLRVHRQKREMTARSDHYAIEGTVHLLPGNALDRMVLRTRQHFLPITDAVVETAAAPGETSWHETVLLNIVNVGEELVLTVI